MLVAFARIAEALMMIPGIFTNFAMCSDWKIVMFHGYKHCCDNANVPTIIWKERFVLQITQNIAI